MPKSRCSDDVGIPSIYLIEKDVHIEYFEI